VAGTTSGIAALTRHLPILRLVMFDMSRQDGGGDCYCVWDSDGASYRHAATREVLSVRQGTPTRYGIAFMDSMITCTYP